MSFSAPKVYTMPGFRTNVKNLQAITKGIKSASFKAKAQEIVNLYVDKKIRNIRTAENALFRLSQPRYQRSGQAEVAYQKVVNQYRGAEPMTGRLRRETLRKDIKTYSATMILFKKVENWKKEAKKEPDPTLLVNVTPELKQEVKTRKFRDLRQFYIGTFDIRLDGVDLEWLQSVHETLIRKDRKVGVDKDGNDIFDPDFPKMVKLMIDKNVIFKDLMESTGNSYLEAVYLMNITDSETKGRAFEPRKRKNRDTAKVGAYYLYNYVAMDLTKDTFKEAIQNNNYTKDECFLNTIYDFYRDNLLNPDKKRNVITREIILETIGKTEENVKEGLSIDDVLPFFEKHRLQLRIFDKFYQVDPDNTGQVRGFGLGLYYARQFVQNHFHRRRGQILRGMHPVEGRPVGRAMGLAD